MAEGEASDMAGERESCVEYYERDFEWLSHVLDAFDARDVEDDLKREMEEGDGDGDGRTAISAWYVVVLWLFC